MKYLKYIVIALAVAFVATSCDKKDPDFNSQPIDGLAQVQVFMMTPVRNVSDNYVYAITLNDDLHANKFAALMTPYNGAPGGTTGAYWGVPAGDVRVRLQRIDSRKEKILDWEKPYNDDGTRNEKDTTIYWYTEPFYDQVATGLEAGKKYYLVVYDESKAPILIDQQEPPTQVTTNTAEYCSVRLLNFMWEDDNTPYAGKVQLRLLNTQSGEYENVGDPIAFGEATEWFMPSVIKTSYNTAGTQRRDLDLVDSTTGERLQVVNSRGTEYGFTDYWTLGIGRGYTWFLYGTRTTTTCPVAIRNWTLR